MSNDTPYFRELRYLRNRLSATIINLLVAAAFYSLFNMLSQLPQTYATLFGTIRLEAEELKNQGYQRSKHAWASNGALVETARDGRLFGTFPGKSDTYDIIICAKDFRGESKSQFLIRIGDNSFRTENTLQEGALVRKLFARNVKVKELDKIEIAGTNEGSEFAAIDYLDFVVSSSTAFRPNDNEKSYRYGTFYRIIGYDDMNVHYFLLGSFATLLVLNLFSLGLTDSDPGSLIVGHRIRAAHGTPGFLRSFLHSSGILFSVLSGGLGFLLVFISPFGQSLANLMSGTYVVPAMYTGASSLKYRPEVSVFSKGAGFAAAPPNVSLYQRAGALFIDLFLITLISFSASVVYQCFGHEGDKPDDIRLEAEDLTAVNFRNSPWVYASGSMVAYSRTMEDASEIKGQFKGSSGLYDVGIAFGAIRFTDSPEIEVQIGDRIVRVRPPYREMDSPLVNALIPVARNVHLKSGTKIRIKKLPAFHSVAVDFIQISHSNTPPGIHRMGYYRLQDNLPDVIKELLSLQAILILLTCCYIIYYVTGMYSVGATLGMHITGIKVEYYSESGFPRLKCIGTRLLLVVPVTLFGKLAFKDDPLSSISKSRVVLSQIHL